MYNLNSMIINNDCTILPEIYNHLISYKYTLISKKEKLHQSIKSASTEP